MAAGGSGWVNPLSGESPRLRWISGGFRDRVSVHDGRTDEWVLQNDVGGKAPHEEEQQHDDGSDRITIFSKTSRKMVGMLILSSALSGSLSFGVDLATMALSDLRSWLLLRLGGQLPHFMLAWAFDATLICAARLAVHGSPQAAGSGIPEVKVILSGKTMLNFLTMPVMLAKGIGLACGLGGGLPLGKEGPFVHMSACISEWLHKSNGWSHRSKTYEVMLLASVSVGVGVSFSAPVGGVLFALELMMPHLYDIVMYRACFMAATVASAAYLALTAISAGGPPVLISADLRFVWVSGFLPALLFVGLCMLLGVVCGIFGGLFVWSHRIAGRAMKVLRGIPDSSLKPSGLPRRWSFSLKAALLPRDAGQSLSQDLLILSAFAAIGAAFSLGPPLLGMGMSPLLSQMFSNACLPELSYGTIVTVFAARWLHSAVALTLPVPSGCLAPVLVLGALIGRAAGRVLPRDFREVLAPDTDGLCELEARFAIVGAATMAASVTRTVSIVVTIFELIAVPQLVLPLALANLTAISFGNLISLSIFDEILAARKVPALPTLQAMHQGGKPIGRVLRPRLLELVLPRHAVPEDVDRVAQALEAAASEANGAGRLLTLPIVDATMGPGRGVLVGAVPAADLPAIAGSVRSAAQRDGPVDVLAAAASGGLLVTPIQVSPRRQVRRVYLEMQAKHSDQTVMVVSQGQFMGMATEEDLLQLT